MTKAAIYARYSTELQSDRSVEDQVALCEDFAAREGLTVTARLWDRARTGGSVHGRDGLAELMRMAQAGEIDVVVTEALDRLSRDMEDLAGIYKRLSFAGITVRAVHEGQVNSVLVGLRGLIGQMYREDNAHKVRRGLRGRFNDGIIISKLPYGYRPVQGQPGTREIAPEQAEIIRRIFTDYAGGHSPRAIAVALNDEGVISPGGSAWRAQTLLGNRKRGLGILRNEHYIGVMHWGRTRNVRNPETGRIVQRICAEDGARLERPDLAIVPPDLWRAVQQRLEEMFRAPAGLRRMPTHFLSGLLRCGGCGGPMRGGGVANGRQRIRCGHHNDGVTCPAPRTYYLDVVQEAVVNGLRTEMSAPDVLAEFVRTYHEERRRLAAQRAASQGEARRRLASISRELERVIDCIAKGYGDPATLGPRSTELHRQKQTLQTEIDAAPAADNIVALHPAAVARYEETLRNLSGALDCPDPTLAAPLRELIEHVAIYGEPGRGGAIRIEITGRLNALLCEGAYPDGVCASTNSTSQKGSSTHIAPIPFRITVAA